MKTLHNICEGLITINPLVTMEATIVKIGNAAIVKTINETVRCKDLQQAVFILKSKGWKLTNKDILPPFFLKQL